MQIRIEKASLKYLDSLAELFQGYLTFYRKEFQLDESKTFLKERIEKKESEIFFAIDETDEIHGFVQLYPIFSSTRMQKLWLLNDLFVKENSRGSGISKMLIERCKHLCVDSKSCGMILETEKTNIIGNILYPKTGFSRDSDHNFYYWDC